MTKLFLLMLLVPGLAWAQAASGPDLTAGSVTNLDWGSAQVGAWLLAVGSCICFALGYISGRQR